MTRITALSTLPPPPSTSTYRSTSSTTPVDILILGAGWTFQFLSPLLVEEHISHSATTRYGRHGSIPFDFDPESEYTAPYERLPPAKTVLITFPLKGQGQSKRLTGMYQKTHTGVESRWVQLGSTGIFTDRGWNDEDSGYDKNNARAVAEDELLEILGRKGCVLNLAGLYGGERDPRNWVIRVAKTKAEVKGKLAVHLVHGRDVARAIVATHEAFGNVGGKRWIINDLHVYDWWDLILSWGKFARENAGAEVKRQAEEKEKEAGVGDEGDGGLQYEEWVVELMEEEGVRALPREVSGLGRVLDGRGFWAAVGSAPGEGRAN